MEETYYYPNRTTLSSSRLRVCLYDAECPGYTSCINNECIMPYLPGHSCKSEPSKGPFIGLKKDIMPGEDEGGCINMICDSYTRTCQSEERNQEEDSYAAISCTMDSDCPFQHSCDVLSGMCVKLPTITQSCSGSCIKPYICYQGACRLPCLSDYDCYIGSARTDTTNWACMTVYNACMVSTEGVRPSETELDLYFGEVPKSFTTPDFPESTATTPKVEPSTSNSSEVPSGTASEEPLINDSNHAPVVDPSYPFQGDKDDSNTGKADEANSSTGERSGDNSKMILIAGAAGGGVLLLILILVIWRVVKKRRSNSSISTSSYGKKSHYPAVAPAYVSAMGSSSSTTTDFKDPNFGMKANTAFSDAPPIYK